MSGYARFNRNFLLLVCVSCALVGIVNYVVDPYNVFGTRFLHHRTNINDRFMKIDFIKQQRQRFNSYILGSSRAGVIDPRRLERYLPGSSFYNLSVTAGTQYDNLKHLEYLIERQYEIRNLYLQIVLDFLTENISATEYGRQLHPDVADRSKVLTYVEYLTILPMKQIRVKVRMNLTNRPKGSDYDLENTGMLLFTNSEERIRKDPAGYISEETSFHENPKRMKYADTTANIAALKAVKRLCDATHIRCLFFTSPLHHATMDSLNVHNYVESLRGISEITTFYDFTGYNTVMLDDHNYYEASHYRPHVAELVAARISDDTTVRVPDDFGRLITHDNVEKHVQTVLEQIALRDRLSNRLRLL